MLRKESHITEAGVIFVYAKASKLQPNVRLGIVRAIEKKPHVIIAALWLDYLTNSCMFIMWTVT
jgi:hypothetical protein